MHGVCCACCRVGVERAERLFSEVDRAAKRLEELSDKRRERLREIARMRALEDETSQVSLQLHLSRLYSCLQVMNETDSWRQGEEQTGLEQPHQSFVTTLHLRSKVNGLNFVFLEIHSHLMYRIRVRYDIIFIVV